MYYKTNITLSLTELTYLHTTIIIEYICSGFFFLFWVNALSYKPSWSWTWNSPASVTLIPWLQAYVSSPSLEYVCTFALSLNHNSQSQLWRLTFMPFIHNFWWNFDLLWHMEVSILKIHMNMVITIDFIGRCRMFNKFWLVLVKWEHNTHSPWLLLR